MTILGRFIEAAEAVAARVAVFDGVDSLAAHCRELAAGGAVVVAPSLSAANPRLQSALFGVGAHQPDPGSPAASAADAAVGVVAGAMAVAETGSVAVSEHALEDRVVTMLTRHLVIAVEADDIRPSLDDLAVWMQSTAQGPGFASVISGPSRTADIERSLTIGVQGPEAVTVAVLA